MVLQKTLLGSLVLAGAMTIMACAPATSGGGDSGPKPFGGVSELDGWISGPGDGNTFDADNFRLKYVSHGAGHALAYQYGASASYGLANLYVDPMAIDDYSGYDQLQFDVKTDVPVNFGTVLRGNDGADSVEVWQTAGADQYQGPTDGDYVTHTQSLDDFNDMTGWGSDSSYDTATEFLDATADAAVWTQLNFLVTHNPGDPVTNAPGSKIVVYIDNIRLHDSTGTNEDKVLFDFETAE